MNYTTAIFLIDDTVRAVICQYEPEEGARAPVKQYVFKTLDQSVKVDDLVVVPSGTRWGMTVVKIVAVDVDIDFDDSIQLKWVVAKIDPEPYTTLLAQEEKALTMIRSAEKTKKRSALRDALLADNEGLKEFSLGTGATVLLYDGSVPPTTQG